MLGIALVGVVALLAWVAYSRAGNAGDTEMARLPNVVGQTRSEAEETLRSRGFRVESQTKQSSEADAGKVVAQSPSDGEAERGSAVEIVIGQGPQTEGRPAPDEASGPAPGYTLVEDPTGDLTVEVPEEWTILTGSDSEYPGIQVKNWSNWAGEDIESSITVTPNLADWHDLDPPVPGAYIVASRALAQNYTNDELLYSTLYAGQVQNCQEGPSEEYRRSSLSGKMQTWYDCQGQGITNFLVAAAPEGRECVVFAQVRMTSLADREAAQHILDTLKADCGGIAGVRYQGSFAVVLGEDSSPG